MTGHGQCRNFIARFSSATPAGTAELHKICAHGHVSGLQPTARQYVDGCTKILKGSGSQVGRVGVQFIRVIRLGALEDDQQHNEHARVDEVADALHAEGQHHLHIIFLSRLWSWLMHG